MSNKILLLLLGLVIGLIVLIFNQEILDALGIQNEGSNKVFSNDLTNESIVSFTVDKPDTELIEVKRVVDAWEVNGYEGSSTIDSIIESIVTLETSKVASKNEQNFENFEVTEDTGILVTLTTQGGSNHMLIVGKSGTTPNTFYVRKPGDTSVYMVTSSLRGFLIQDLDDWREKVLFEVSESEASEMEVLNGNRSYTAKKDNDSKWTIQYGTVSAVVSDSAKNKIFTSLLRVEAQGFSDTVSVEAVKNNYDSKVTIKFGDELIELWLQSQESTWLAVTSNKEYVFELSNHALNAILTDPATLTTSAGNQ